MSLHLTYQSSLLTKLKTLYRRFIDMVNKGAIYQGKYELLAFIATISSKETS
jgi:hypothetical protein